LTPSNESTFSGNKEKFDNNVAEDKKNQ